MPKSLNNLEIRSLSIALLLDLSVILNQRDLTSRPKKPMSMRYKSMEEVLKTKLTLLINSLKKKLLLIKSSKTLKPSMFWEPLKVKDFVESSKDSVVRNYQENHIEVLERSDVLDHGIHQESNGLLPELVKWVIIIEQIKIRRFIE